MSSPPRIDMRRNDSCMFLTVKGVANGHSKALMNINHCCSIVPALWIKLLRHCQAGGVRDTLEVQAKARGKQGPRRPWQLMQYEGAPPTDQKRDDPKEVSLEASAAASSPPATGGGPHMVSSSLGDLKAQPADAP